VWYERLTLARLLAGLGHEREALAVLDREFPRLRSGFPYLHAETWALERARLAEKNGAKPRRHVIGMVL
jgi:hypothetical protein